MKAIKIGTNRLISIVLSIVMCATILTGAIWALSNLFKTGMSIVVTYDAPVNAKVYLSTDSTVAGTLRQPSSDNIVTVHNFKKANSAIVLNTTGNDNNNDGAQSKTDFENLGKNGSSLICDANGEMQFYVYVENFSTTDSIYYRANISFNGETPEGEATPFSVVKNPSYAVSEAVSDSAGGGGVTSSLLAFKIALNSEFEGDIRADQITIKIELNTSYLGLLGFGGSSGFYDDTETGITANYKGLYWIELGEYPQSQETNSTIISAMSTTVDSKGYYTSFANGKKYARKGTEPNGPFTYYKVEPVRWLIIGNGSDLNGKGFPDKNDVREGYSDLLSNQMLLISEKVLFKYIYSNVGGPVYWTQSTLFDYLENDITGQIFSKSDLSLLGDFKETKTTTPDIFYTFKLSLLTHLY